jgi:adenylate cyclase
VRFVKKHTIIIKFGENLKTRKQKFMPSGSAEGQWEQDVQVISDWLISRTLGDADLPTILDGLCERLLAIGLTIKRVHLVMDTLHPTTQAEAFRWVRGHETEHEDFPHQIEPREDWLRSPIKALIESGEMEMRHVLITNGDWQQFPYLETLRNEGITDYFAMLTAFRPFDDVNFANDGMIVSWSSNSSEGFSEQHLNALRRLQPRLGLAAKIANREHKISNLLSAYLGDGAANRVLSGQVQRGSGDVIPCVILYSDLRHSTTFADSMPGPDFLALLNSYFECTAGAVLEHKGEVLRFIGDAVLAIFPIGEGQFTTEKACAAAYDAALDAERRVIELNKNRATAKDPMLEFGLALHIGEVLFGNIGVAERVEFSVIGPAANEVCRLEGLTKNIGQSIVVSSEFAGSMKNDWQDLGRHELRGVSEPRQVYGVP